MNITQQKTIADHILEQMFTIDPYVILAGGAPRDWLLGNTANDLDIYFYSHANARDTKKQLEIALGQSVAYLSKDSPAKSMYKHMEALVRVFETTIKGMKVQLIQLATPKDTFRVVDKMSVSICKAWYKGGVINTHTDFKLTQRSGIMFLSEGYKWSDPHPKKMCERFRGVYRQGDRERCVKALLDKLEEKE